MHQKIVSFIETESAEFLDANGLEIVDIEYSKEGTDWYLRIYIDKEDGITINDCSIYTKYINKILDEKDPIKNAYILEVSSPGGRSKKPNKKTGGNNKNA